MSCCDAAPRLWVSDVVATNGETSCEIAGRRLGRNIKTDCSELWVAKDVAMEGATRSDTAIQRADGRYRQGATATPGGSIVYSVRGCQPEMLVRSNGVQG